MRKKTVPADEAVDEGLANLTAPLPDSLVRRKAAQADEFAGQGGRYVLGADGRRRRVEETRDRGAWAPAATRE